MTLRRRVPGRFERGIVFEAAPRRNVAFGVVTPNSSATARMREAARFAKGFLVTL
jgi:hypothetical protein